MKIKIKKTKIALNNEQLTLLRKALIGRCAWLRLNGYKTDRSAELLALIEAIEKESKMLKSTP